MQLVKSLLKTEPEAALPLPGSMEGKQRLQDLSLLAQVHSRQGFIFLSKDKLTIKKKF